MSIFYKSCQYILIFWGIIIRVRQYLSIRSLWLDEACLGLNLMEKSYSGLAGPLDYNQAAPMLFLYTVKFLGQVFGYSELVLRFVPLLAGVFSILLFYLIMRRMFDEKTVCLGLFFFVFSGPLIYYSQELKPYSTDVFWLLLFFLCVSKHHQWNWKYSLLLGLAGSVSLLCSFPAVFVILAFSFYLGILYYNTREKMILIPLLSWMVAVAVFIFFILGNANNSMLREYWNFAFVQLPLDMASLERNAHILANVVQFAGIPFISVSLGIILFLSGLFRLRSKPDIAVLIFLVLIAALFASMIGFYPFSGRMILFLLPLFYMSVAYGLSCLSTSKHVLFWLCVLFLLVPFLKQGITLSIKPFEMEEIKPLLEKYNENKQNDTHLFLYPKAVPAFRFYRSNYHIKDEEYTIGIPDSIPALTRTQFWILYTHRQRNHEYPQYSGWDKTVYEETGASLIRYNKQSRY